MEVSASAKKVMAIMAVIDDTQDQIRRIKNAYDEQIRIIREQARTEANTLQLNLEAQYDALSNLIGSSPDYDTDRGQYGPARKSTNVFDRIKNKALLYIGKQMLYPELEKEVDNGQTLSSTNDSI